MLLEFDPQCLSQSCHPHSVTVEGWSERGEICVVPIPLFNKLEWNTLNFRACFECPAESEL